MNPLLACINVMTFVMMMQMWLQIALKQIKTRLMKILIRPLDLVNKKGKLMMDLDENIMNIKDGIWYMDEKTKHLTDEEYLEWLKSKVEEPFSYADNIEIEMDIFSPKFAHLQKKHSQLRIARSLVIDLLAEQNGLLDDNQTEHIIKEF